MDKNDIVIVSGVRTPIGSFLGTLSSFSAVELGSIAIRESISKIGLDKDLVQEVFMGNVLQANQGQAPARQASILAGLSNQVVCTTVNKVCASGMKSVIMAAQTIKSGDNQIVIAGGMESMSNVPHYLNLRVPNKLGDAKMVDGMVKDGLTDSYDNKHMGVHAETCAKNYEISREEQDRFAINSYLKSKKAWEEGRFDEEIVPVEIKTKKGSYIVSEDEEYKNVNFDKISQLKPVFLKEGTVTAANASTLNDGASALVIMLRERAEELGIKPLAKIVNYADAACEPFNFTIAPSKAVNKLIDKAGIRIEQVDYFEFNEAFSVVGIANSKILGLSEQNINVNGGAVSLGHPLGNSGSRIIITLMNVLKQNNAKYGVASICNGGGGASAILIENI